MKKMVKWLFSAFVFAIMISFLNVFADDGDTNTVTDSDSKSVVSLNVSVSGNSLLISGETEGGMLAVAVAVYNKSGEKLVTMQTAAVNDDNSYKTSIEVEDGTYLIKVADYQGGNFLTKLVTVGSANKKQSENSETKKDDKGSENTESSANQTKTVYFPNTNDDGKYIVFLSNFGMVSALSVFAFTKKKKTCYKYNR